MEAFRFTKFKLKHKFFSLLTLMFYTSLYIINEFFVNVVSVEFLVNSIVVISVVYSFIVFKLFHLHSVVVLFFICFALFILSRIYLHFFGLNTILTSSSFYWGTLNKEALLKALFVVLISLLSVFYGVFLNKVNVKPNIRKSTSAFVVSSSKLGNLILTIFILLLPGTIYKYYHDLIEIINNGYLALYSSASVSPAPLFARVSWFLYTLFLPLAFSIKFKRIKTTKLLILFLLLISLLDSIKGSRAAFIRPVFFCFWYYYTFFSNKKIALLKLLPYVSLLLFFIIYMVMTRGGGEFKLEHLEEIPNLIFYHQGISFNVIVLFFQFKEQFIYPSRWYILTPITSFYDYNFNKAVFGGERNLDMLKHSFSVDYKLMHAVNSEMFLNGYGLGGSYMIELFALAGIFSVILGSVLVGYLLVWFDKNVTSKISLIIFSWYFVNHVIFFSRGTYLLGLVNVSLTFIVFYLLKKIARSVW